MCIWNWTWNSKTNLSYAPETMSSAGGRTDKVNPVTTTAPPPPPPPPPSNNPPPPTHTHTHTHSHTHTTTTKLFVLSGLQKHTCPDIQISYTWCVYNLSHSVIDVFDEHGELPQRVRIGNPSYINWITDVRHITPLSFKFMLIYYGFKIIWCPENLHSVPLHKDIHMQYYGYLMPSPYVYIDMDIQVYIYIYIYIYIFIYI